MLIFRVKSYQKKQFCTTVCSQYMYALDVMSVMLLQGPRPLPQLLLFLRLLLPK